MMKICFLVELPKSVYPSMIEWADGLRGAMRLLEKEYEVCYHVDGELHDHTPDVLICWGGILAKTFREGLAFKGKKILCFGGGPITRDLDPYYVLFENNIFTTTAKGLGLRCMTAFGTDTSIFKPLKQPKVFDVVYPGAFGLWKRKDLFATACKGLKAFTFGNVQAHEMECWTVCEDNDIMVCPSFPQEDLPWIYAMSKSVITLPVPMGGGQRTVLEAMAMKIPIIVPSDAPLVIEYAIHGGIITMPDAVSIRHAVTHLEEADVEKAYQYVMDHLTEKHYADKIKEAIALS